MLQTFYVGREREVHSRQTLVSCLSVGQGFCFRASAIPIQHETYLVQFFIYCSYETPDGVKATMLSCKSRQYAAFHFHHKLSRPRKSCRYPSLSTTTAHLVHSSSLLEQAINLVLVFQLEHLGRLVFFNALAVQQESKRADLNTAARRIRLENLLHLGRLFDLEESLFSGL